MYSVLISDPSWETTFAHRVSLREEEWLAGVLLCCDEANFWDSGTTASFLFKETQTKNSLSVASLVIPSSFSLAPLAQWLAVPEDVLYRTTYHTEFAQLYDVLIPHTGLLSRDILFHFCPVCIAESRMLRRTLTLPHLQCCPIHHVLLSDQCECGNNLTVEQLAGPGLTGKDYAFVQLLGSLSTGTSQNIFSSRKRPFTCRRCGLDWSKFPQHQADSQRIILEQKILSWYDFFFSKGSRLLLERALQLIQQKLGEKKVKSVKRLDGKSVAFNFHSPEKSSLARIVDVLVSLNICPNDIEADESPLQWRPIGWRTFYCPVSTCPYMQLTEEQMGLQRNNVCSLPVKD